MSFSDLEIAYVLRNVLGECQGPVEEPRSLVCFASEGPLACPLPRNKQGCAFGFRAQSTGLFHTLILCHMLHAKR